MTPTGDPAHSPGMGPDGELESNRDPLVLGLKLNHRATPAGLTVILNGYTLTVELMPIY